MLACKREREEGEGGKEGGKSRPGQREEIEQQKACNAQRRTCLIAAQSCKQETKEDENKNPGRHPEQRHLPSPGNYVSGNLWNLDIPTVSKNPGPMGSLTRHVTTMQSPTNPSYVDSGLSPVSISFEQIQPSRMFRHIKPTWRGCSSKFEQKFNTLRSWTNMVQDQIQGEAAQVHHQLVQMMLTIHQQQSPHPWSQEWTETPVWPPTATLPRPVQPTPQPVPVKPAPARHQAHFDKRSSSEPAFPGADGCRSMGTILNQSENHPHNLVWLKA